MPSGYDRVATFKNPRQLGLPAQNQVFQHSSFGWEEPKLLTKSYGQLGFWGLSRGIQFPSRVWLLNDSTPMSVSVVNCYKKKKMELIVIKIKTLSWGIRM